MAKGERGRFSRSGHISYSPNGSPHDSRAANDGDERGARAAEHADPPGSDHGARDEHGTRRIPDAMHDEFRRDDYDRSPVRRPGYGQPTYHRGHTPPPDTSGPTDPAADGTTPFAAAGPTTAMPAAASRATADAPTEIRVDGDVGVGAGGDVGDATTPPRATRTLDARQLGRATVHGTGRAARNVTRRVITASKSDGAAESGLTALIWNQVLSYGTDAMVTVALAGTVFFGASSDAQRGNVLLYLLVTMAPFAVVAPVIGPALDRLQHGRRWTMAGTAIGRMVLALIMAAHPTELLVLYPCALGSLVLSKAYAVIRSAATPRLVPPTMTLTEANAKLTVFGLGSTVVLGGLVGVIIKVSGSYTAGLIVTAVAFGVCAWFAFKLPKQVDSTTKAPRHPEEPLRPRSQDRVPTLHRLHQWARRGFDPHLVMALQGESVLRLLSGMLTIYLAFYVESTSHGVTAAVELAAVVGAAGAGNFLGTAIGTRVRLAKPELLIVASTVAVAVVCVLAAVMFSIVVACVAMLLSAVANALSKIALDALIQQDVPETLRSSAFARSETFLQLAWVLGAGLGVALPSNGDADGAIAFVVAAVITGLVAALVVLRQRAMSRPERPATPVDTLASRTHD